MSFIKRMTHKPVYEIKYTFADDEVYTLKELEVVYNGPNNQHKELSFDEWILEATKLGFLKKVKADTDNYTY